MTSTTSSRTPEGVSNHCPICDTSICIEPAHPAGDAPCPSCGTLLWFFDTSAGMQIYESKAVAPLRDRIIQIICEFGALTKNEVIPAASIVEDLGIESLDDLELIMELEEKLSVTISDVDVETIKTVGDVIDYFAKRKL